MSRSTFNLFFDPCFVLCVTDRVNNIIQDNRKLNIMVESVGVLRHTLRISGESDVNKDKIIALKSGYMIIRLSSDNMYEMEKILDSDELLIMHEVSAFPDVVFPKEIFFTDSIDNENIFLKKVKGKAITSGNLAEMEKSLLGVVQDTGHYVEQVNCNMARLDVVIAYFLLPGEYVVAIDDSDVLGSRHCMGIPGLRISHPKLKLSLSIEPYDGEQDCLSCYILNNYNEWIIKLEAFNHLSDLVGDISVTDGKLNIKVEIPEEQQLEIVDNNITS